MAWEYRTMERDRAGWDDRYADAEPPRQRPPDAITNAELIDCLPTTGRVLDVACGTGAVTLWALGRGLGVIALDISGVAIEMLIDAAAPPPETLIAQPFDLDDGLPEDIGEFELVVCQRFWDAAVIRSLPAYVAPGGWLVVTTLSEVGAAHPGTFHASLDQLSDLLPADKAGWTTIVTTEADGEASIVLRRWRTTEGTATA